MRPSLANVAGVVGVSSLLLMAAHACVTLLRGDNAPDGGRCFLSFLSLRLPLSHQGCPRHDTHILLHNNASDARVKDSRLSSSKPLGVLARSRELLDNNSESVIASLYKTDLGAISRTNKLVYVHVPKTGGTSIVHSALFADAHNRHKKYGAEPFGGHQDIHLMMENGIERGISDFLKTAHIRHPCSRFVSAYYYLISDMSSPPDKAWARKNIGNLTIDEFVVKLESIPPGIPRFHLKFHLVPQHKWLFSRSSKNKTFGLDMVLCQETWRESLDKLSERLNKPVPTELYSLHHKQNWHEPCQGLKQETREAIERIYHMDYCIFGYYRQPTNSCPQAELPPDEFTYRYKVCSSLGSNGTIYAYM